jgi:hypothetical protein
VTSKSIGYVTGYVVKKMTRADDPRLNGLTPEFALMSRRPGIGAGTADAIAKWVNGAVGVAELCATGDVPREVRVEGKKSRLPRYLVRRVRAQSGIEEYSRLDLYAEEAKARLGRPSLRYALREEGRRQRALEYYAVSREDRESRRMQGAYEAQGRYRRLMTKRTI